MFRQDKSAVKGLLDSVPNYGDKKVSPPIDGDTLDCVELAEKSFFQSV